MTNPNLTYIERLNFLAKSIGASWEECSSIDWNQAEELVNTCRMAPVAVRAQSPEIESVLSHADSQPDWDSGEVAQWPALLVEGTDRLIEKVSQLGREMEGPGF